MKLQKTAICLGSLLALSLPAGASNPVFEQNFADSTLRVDYILGGNANETHVFLDRQSKSAGWAGRRHNLDRLPLTGNGIVTMTDAATGDTLYRTSFSTLFSEWQRTDESKEMDRSYQNTFIMPLPLREAKVTVEILNPHHQPVASTSHIYSPNDILVSRKPASPYQTRYLHKGGDPKEAIDVAILAEGYTADEMEEFFDHAQTAVDAIFSHEPFGKRRDDFNFVAVASESHDSGVSVPLDNDWKSTVFGSHYSTFYSDRYLTTPDVHRVHDALTGIPYEHIIILAKSPVYGGGGIYNSYTLTTSGHKDFRPVVVHEFGHSFGGLADEYFYEEDTMSDSYPTDVEPWEPNVTTLIDFDGKWKSIIPEGTPIPTDAKQADKYPVGVFEGAAYSFKGLYRPADECRMRNNTYPTFCPGCQKALTELIDFYTGK